MSPISNFTEIRPVGIALIHVDRQTDRQTDKQTEDKKGGWTKSLLPSQTKKLLRRFNIAGNHKIHLGLHIECPIFLPDFNQI
jgi:hypothetical protein